MTISVTAAIVLIVATFMQPWLADEGLLAQLASSDPKVRELAIVDAADRMEQWPSTRQRLEAALDSASDRQFLAIAEALNLIKRFDTKTQTPLHIDRLLTLQFATTEGLLMRRFILRGIINRCRKSSYVFDALRNAAADPESILRKRAALLAAALGDDAVLAKLLADADPGVRAAAALDVGIAKRTELTDQLIALLADSDAGVAGYAAVALAKMDAGKHADTLVAMLTDANTWTNPYVIYASALTGDKRAFDIIRERIGVFHESPLTDQTLIAIAGEFNITPDANTLRGLQLNARVYGRRTAGLERAIIALADKHQALLADRVQELCTNRWSSATERLMTIAARALGRASQAKGAEDSAGAYLATLRIAAAYPDSASGRRTTQADIRPTPIASAAAAVACWLAKPTTAPADSRLITDVARSDSPLAGHYIAWHLARENPTQAYTLGMNLLSGHEQAGFLSENVRACAAMMVGLSAKTDDQKKKAIEVISSRLQAEDNLVLQGTYRCALLVLGERQFLETVRAQCLSADYPLATNLTALLSAGDMKSMEQVLSNERIGPWHLADLAYRFQLADILKRYRPDIASINIVATPALQRLQAEIAMHTFTICRDRWCGEVR